MGRAIIKRAAGLLTALLLAVVPACGQPQPRWTRVDLPGAGEIVALAPGPSGVLVGRYDTTVMTRSSLQLVGEDGRIRPVPLEQGPGYAAEARLVSISASGDRVIALGEARGGAHGNPRSTVWSGDLTGLREQPQTFETFGGWDAGGLVGSAYGNDGPILIGAWRAQAGPGFDVAVWRQDGDRWVRAAPDAVLRATETRQPAAAAVTSTSDRYVAVGSTTSLGTVPRVTPTAWVASRATGPWEEFPLTPMAPDGGEARATVVSCVADHCVVAGRDGGQVLVWRLTFTGRGKPSVSKPIRVRDHVPEDARLGVAAQTSGHRSGDQVAVSASTDAPAAELVVVRVQDQADPEFATPGTLTGMTTGPGGRAYLAITHPSGAAQLWTPAG